MSTTIMTADGTVIAEIPPWPERALLDEHGRIVYAEPRCDAICDAASGGSCFTPWCRCSCHRIPDARRADWQRSDLW